ncbi:MAG: acyltransferase [Flavobacteriales bacterium]|nr:acyltransferase [Flavobacteriales bacterium]MEB2340794.1 acyltransferase [Flavobacteriia bacterium]
MRWIINLFRLDPDYNKRVFGLDLMRSLAIIFVVMGHGWMLNKANTGFPWIRLIDGVELFFVLSGFLIGTILIRTFHAEAPLTARTLGSFWIRRWFRTLPNYYLILFLNVVFVYFGVIHEDGSRFGWRYFLFMQNFSQPLLGFFWESWSLTIEEWFYLTFPLILAGLYLLLRNTKLGKRHIFLTAILIFLATPFLLRATIASKFELDQFWLDVRIQKVVIYRLDGIALGLLAAYLKYWYPALWRKGANVAFVAGLLLNYLILYSEWPPNNFATKVYRPVLQSFACFLLLPKFDGMRKAPPLVTKVFTHISLISYSMYLINLALVSEVIRDNFPPTGPVSAWVSYIIYWLVVLVASTLLYKYFEKPMMDLRERFSRKTPAAVSFNGGREP